MIQEFYYGTSWHWPLSYLPRVMLSYNMLRNIKTPWKINIPFMMDSGAYSLITKYGKYLYTVEEYGEGIKKWHPDVAWTMDYPCEPSVQRKGNYNYKEAQEKTIDNQIRLLGLNVNTQMVVQGWTIPEYLENLDKIKEQGLLTERLGIGSICRRGQTKEIARIIRVIYKNVPGWVRLHGFGVKTSILSRTDAPFVLYSADSTSWGYEMRYGDWLKGEYNGKTWQDKVPNLQNFVSKVESYLALAETQMNLEEFVGTGE